MQTHLVGRSADLLGAVGEKSRPAEECGEEKCEEGDCGPSGDSGGDGDGGACGAGESAQGVVWEKSERGESQCCGGPPNGLLSAGVCALADEEERRKLRSEDREHGEGGRASKSERLGLQEGKKAEDMAESLSEGTAAGLRVAGASGTKGRGEEGR